MNTASHDAAVRPLAVTQINTDDEAGGAARLCGDLHSALRSLGVESHLAVGNRRDGNRDATQIPNDRFRGMWNRVRLSTTDTARRHIPRVRGRGRIDAALAGMAQPDRWVAEMKGREYFNFPATWHPESWAGRADLLHCHNLHGGYFDLRALPMLSRRWPVVVTMHDMWLLTGHCAHSFDCDRWKSGCGDCPDLRIPPAIKRDATCHNWGVKRGIFGASKLHVATPSRWLLRKVEGSVLASGLEDARVIANGVDLTVFHPRRRHEARGSVGLNPNEVTLVYAANGGISNPWKDYATVEAAAAAAASDIKRPVTLVVIGGSGADHEIGNMRVRHVSWLSDRSVFADYLCAADVCVHAAGAENFSLFLCEALACGVPVVSVSCGGTPELVRDGRCGLLVSPGDVRAYGEALRTLLSDDAKRTAFGAAAAAHARARLGLDRMAAAYRDWYVEIIDSAAVRSRRV